MSPFTPRPSWWCRLLLFCHFYIVTDNSACRLLMGESSLPPCSQARKSQSICSLRCTLSATFAYFLFRLIAFHYGMHLNGICPSKCVCVDVYVNVCLYVCVDIRVVVRGEPPIYGWENEQSFRATLSPTHPERPDICTEGQASRKKKRNVPRGRYDKASPHHILPFWS